MLTITVRIGGRRFHLVAQPDDCRSCVNRDEHKPLERPALIADELARAVRGDGSLLASLRDVVVTSVSLHNPSRVSDVEIATHVATLLRTNRLIAVECPIPLS